MKGFEMGKDNRDQNTTPPYKGAMHGEDWDGYLVRTTRMLREIKEKGIVRKTQRAEYNEKNFVHSPRSEYSPDVIAVVSGGFDPIHAGHIALIREAASIGKVHVLLNSDAWLRRKKGRAFLDYHTRADILCEFASVHSVSPVADGDGTVVSGLRYIKDRYKDSKIAFLNGGDRKEKNTPERTFCEENDVQLVWNVVGGKLASSSSLLEAYNFPVGSSTVRPWGEYEVFAKGKNWQGKILRINPGRALSLQRHFKREERWVVVQGEGEVWVNEAFLHKKLKPLQVGSVVEIAKKEYHWLHNTSSSEQLIIIEAWLGEELSESDIERVDYDAAAIFIQE